MSHPENVYLGAELRIEAAGGQQGPRVEIDPAYAGGAILASPGPEPVVVDVAGVTIPDGVPLCRDHSAKTFDRLGELTVTADGREIRATGYMNQSEAAREIIRLWKSDPGLQASIGVEIKRSRTIKPGEAIAVNGRVLTAGGEGLMLIEAGILREISIVGIGADGSTCVTIEASARGQKGNTGMDTKQQTEAAVQAERTRVSGITKLAAQYSDIIGAGRVGEVRDKAIEDGTTEDAFAKALLPMMNAAFAPPALPMGAPSAGLSSEPAKVVAAAALLSTGYMSVAEAAYDERTLQRAADMAVTNSVDLAAQALITEGRNIPRDRGEMVRAAFSTSTLSEAIRGAAQNVMLESYRATPSHWRAICARRSVPNLESRYAVRPYLTDGMLEQVSPDGKIKTASLDEEAYSFKADQFAKLFSVTRVSIINDAIGSVFALQGDLGRNAARTLNASFWAMIREAEEAGYFSVENGNLLTGVGSTLTVGGFSLAMEALRSMTDADDKPIDVEPGVLACPPAGEAEARAILVSVELNRDGDQEPTGNPWAKAVELAVEPRISEAAGGSNTGWFLFAKPWSVPACIAAFLHGQEQPRVERVPTAADVLGEQYRVVLDFGFALADPRGAIKCTGAVEEVEE